MKNSIIKENGHKIAARMTNPIKTNKYDDIRELDLSNRESERGKSE